DPQICRHDHKLLTLVGGARLQSGLPSIGTIFSNFSRRSANLCRMITHGSIPSFHASLRDSEGTPQAYPSCLGGLQLGFGGYALSHSIHYYLLALLCASRRCRSTSSRLNAAGFCRGGYFTKSSICSATIACIP